MDPSDHDHNELGNGAAGDDAGSTHAPGRPGEDDRWLRSVVEHSSEIVTIVDPDGTLRYANPAWERALGHDPREAVGRMNVLDHVHPDDLSYILEETEKALSEGGIATNEAEYRFRCKDGSWRWMQSVGTYLLDEPYVGVVVQSRDVTERKETEERLRFQARLLDTVGEAVIALDLDGRVSYWNRAAEDLYGWPSEEVMGGRLREMVVPEDLRGRAEEIAAQLREGRAWTGGFEVRRRDGTTFPVEATDTPVFGEDGGLIGVIGVLRDVTERKETEEALRRSEAELFSVLESITDAFFSFDHELRLTYVNPRASVLFSTRREDLVGEKVWEDPTFYPQYERAMREGQTVAFEGYYPPSGAWYSVRVYPSGSGLSVYLQDITERKEAEIRLREAEERYRTLVEHIPAVTYTDPVDDPDTSLYTSPQIEELLGYTPEEWRTQKLWPKRLHPDDRERVLAADERFEKGDKERFDEEYRLLAKDGSVVWVREEAVLVKDGEDTPQYWQGVIYDVTKRREAEERLEHQALHDSLTGLPNRRLLVDRLGQALGRTRRREGLRVAVLFMDLNDFKVVNDSLGHEAGDLLLTVVAQRLKRSLRPEDTLARFGGDEFVVLLEDVEDPGEAVRVAQRITDELRGPFALEGRELHVSASAGISFGAARTKSPEDLLRDADTAMYQAKKDGSGYRVFDPTMYERVVQRLDLENDLRRAVEQEEFVVHYQPIFDFGSQQPWGMEALVRWEHPERGLLGPSEFVPVAEETGLIVPIGAWVLGEACRRTKEWQDGHPRNPPLGVIVNLSAGQLRHPGCEETIREALSRSGLSPESLSLDVTETAFIDALESNRRALERIQATGVRISIDDFGMGYSSLSYLKRLPADALKIDKSFLKGFGEDAQDTAIVRMVIDVAHTLGLRVVAEGVETWAQAALLAETGCDMAQGFHFSEPLPPEATSDFLGSAFRGPSQRDGSDGLSDSD